MTKEDKKLLIKDLSGRLPYKVIVHLSRKHNRPEEDIVLNNIIVGKDNFVTSYIIGYDYLLSEIKPYLRPMSSIASLISAKEWTSFSSIDLIDWYNANHIDYRGLIKKGLALEVTKENNPYEKR